MSATSATGGTTGSKYRSWAVPVVVSILGLGLAAGIASNGKMPAADVAGLLAYAGGGAAAAGLLAAGLLRILRGAPLVSQMLVATLAPVVAVAVGITGAAAAMFITNHDFQTLLVVLVGAGTVAVLTGWAFARRTADASRAIGELARRLGTEGEDRNRRNPTANKTSERPAAGPSAPAELATLHAELETTAARLTESRAQAVALERSRRELVAWVSHDLRTPLAGIRAMVEALEDGVVSDEPTIGRYYATMRREADRLAGLVDDLFELSRIQAGALSLDLERVALDELVSDAVAGASIAAGAKGIDLRGAVGEPSPVVELSTPEMARVVRNLLDNAIRHTPPGGTIRIEAGLAEDGSAAIVSVLDACGGIAESDIDRVFDLAYRGDTARTPGDGGAGLGLAVARGLVEAHHGHISVLNEGDGCRFTVRLPISAPAPSTPAVGTRGGSAVSIASS